MRRWRDAEITNNGSGKRLFLYSYINWKIRWPYSSQNDVNNFTFHLRQLYLGFKFISVKIIMMKYMCKNHKNVFNRAIIFRIIQKPMAKPFF